MNVERCAWNFYGLVQGLVVSVRVMKVSRSPNDIEPDISISVSHGHHSAKKSKLLHSLTQENFLSVGRYSGRYSRQHSHGAARFSQATVTVTWALSGSWNVQRSMTTPWFFFWKLRSGISGLASPAPLMAARPFRLGLVRPQPSTSGHTTVLHSHDGRTTPI